jgi:hypothetical protein
MDILVKDPMLDAENMKTMYIAFIRSVLEYGSVQYMGAAHSAIYYSRPS